MEQDKPFINIPVGVYGGLIAANVLMAYLHPEWWFVGVAGALYFSVCLARLSKKKKASAAVEDSAEKDKKA